MINNYEMDIVISVYKCSTNKSDSQLGSIIKFDEKRILEKLKKDLKSISYIDLSNLSIDASLGRDYGYGTSQLSLKAILSVKTNKVDRNLLGVSTDDKKKINESIIKFIKENFKLQFDGEARIVDYLSEIKHKPNNRKLKI